ncbi:MULTISPECIES: LacI family DNA-binding transcriptional regulator [unclassified Leifsonia]|uniref:LacI family DNA-binding transcriptional regulator n=1 Tax=unclassified Leifsonia TaxID=2663824 RepID=UPI0008A7AD51|nr:MULTISPECIES: LacI family DNA-binding transcriptional regulator [unclassified Leifsonia]SEI14596.1 transcriptional regulator, LacI family [Leifsonia sp. CL154]SFM02182.1 transcriptional regulator, LacI family [Leifsonia sp. CL147]
MRTTQRVTLNEIAKQAGVSVGTVSKVMNRRPDVSEETRQRVMETAKVLDYAPTTFRVNTEDPVVDVVFDSLDNPYSTQVMEGIVHAGAEAGVDVVVRIIPKDNGNDVAWGREVRAKGRTGIIVVTSQMTSEHLRALARASVPLVVVDPINLGRPDVASVGATNWAGGLEAGRHLIDLGHERIGFIGGPRGSGSNQERYHGFRAALENAGLDVDPLITSFGLFTYESGRDLALVQLALPDPPTAIFAGSDTIALGVIEAARSRGLTVPDQLSVVGFDDTRVARWSSPQLTTVRQPLETMGRMALRVILQLQGHETLDSQHVQLSTSLVVRNSTAPRTQIRRPIAR